MKWDQAPRETGDSCGATQIAKPLSCVGFTETEPKQDNDSVACALPVADRESLDRTINAIRQAFGAPSQAQGSKP